jgi:Mrp family chromosome partitioning ATPase
METINQCRYLVAGEKTVNTRRLEQLMGDPAESSEAQNPASPAQRRGLAISGARDVRRVIGGRAVSVRNMALIDAAWENLSGITRNDKPAAQTRQFNEIARRPENASRFDVLRAQLLQAFQKRNLKVLGITSARAGSGASFTTAGLLASFARRKDARVVGLDLNLARPTLHDFFEVIPPGPLSNVIEAEMPLESHLQRATANLALGLSEAVESARSHAPEKSAFNDFLADLTQVLAPDMVICDLPPLLEGDAALSMLPSMDAVLLIADARRTTAAQITECERILSEQAEFLGVVLNRTTGISERH